MSLSSLQAQTISTFAGGGSHVGDGVPATIASFNWPKGLTVDREGNLLIVDSFDNMLRRVSPGGAITTVAGYGAYGHTGDGGPARWATLNQPSSAAVDSNGNIYIADSGNNLVRKVSVDGTISTIAGNGKFDWWNYQEGAPATSVAVGHPLAVAIDSADNLYVSAEDRIRKIGKDGTIRTIVGNAAGTGSGSGDALSFNLNNPAGLAVDGAGNVYIADSNHNRILKLALSGEIVTVAGTGTAGFAGDGGPASSALLNQPLSIAIDKTGNLYIADFVNVRVRKVAPDGIITTVAGTGRLGYSGDGGAAINAQFNVASYVAVDNNGNLYITDFGPATGNNVIRKVSADGRISTIAGNGTNKYRGDGIAATLASFDCPQGIALDGAGNLYIADGGDGGWCGEDRIRKVQANGIISTVAGGGLDPPSDGKSALGVGLLSPTDIALDASGNLYLTDTKHDLILKVSKGITTTIGGQFLQGSYYGDGGSATSAGVYWPQGIARDESGNLLIADRGNNRIRRIGEDGRITTIAGNGGYGYKAEGDGGSALAAELNEPFSVAVDVHGNVFVAQPYINRIRKVDKAGTITTVAGNGTAGYSGDGAAATNAQLNFPTGIALDQAGNLYIADLNNSAIRKVAPDGIITTVVGNGLCGYSGDGGLAASAELCNPYTIAFDGVGNMFISDFGNRVVRKVTNTTAASSPVNLNQFGLTGSWYTPSMGGQGLLLTVYPDSEASGRGVLSGGWYTYEIASSPNRGRQRWFALQGEVLSGAGSAFLGIYTGADGLFNAGPKIAASKVGVAALYLSDCNHAVLHYSFTGSFNFDEEGYIPLSRLDANVGCSSSGGSNSPTSYLMSGAWYDPNTSGQGFYFDVNPLNNLFFAGWYTYAPSGAHELGYNTQRWYTLQDNDFTPGMTIKEGIGIFETTGGVFAVPGGIMTIHAGTAGITFKNCNEATLTYVFTAGTNAGLNGSINLVRLGPTPIGCKLN